MIERAGDIPNLFAKVAAEHPEARWEADGHQYKIVVPATFNVEEFLSGMGELLREA